MPAALAAVAASSTVHSWFGHSGWAEPGPKGTRLGSPSVSSTSTGALAGRRHDSRQARTPWLDRQVEARALGGLARQRRQRPRDLLAVVGQVLTSVQAMSLKPTIAKRSLAAVTVALEVEAVGEGAGRL